LYNEIRRTLASYKDFNSQQHQFPDIYLSTSTDLTDQKVNADIGDPLQQGVALLRVLKDPGFDSSPLLASATFNHIRL
jgi:hypothetical protein